MGDGAADGPGAAEIGGGALGVAVLQQAADAGGADRALVVGELGDDGEADAEGFGALGEVGDVAAAAVAEGEIGAAGEMGGADASVEDIVEEGFGGEEGELAVEGDLVEGLDAQCGQGVGALGGEGEAEGRIFGAEEFAGVGLEGEDGEAGAGPGGVGGAEKVGMAAVDAVEIAEGDGGAAEGFGEVLPRADNVQSGLLAASCADKRRARCCGQATQKRDAWTAITTLPNCC